MTIKRLKELITNIPDETRIYADNGDRLFSGTEFIYVITSPQAPGKAVFQTKEDIDISCELEARFEYYAENDWDELDAFMDMLEDGYTLDDFAYDNDRYLYAKEFMEAHGLI